MRFAVQYAVAVCVLVLLAATATMPAYSQRSSRTRAQARGVPAAPTVAPFTLTSPAVDPGSSGRALYPANDPNGVPAMVYHGARPGPVIAYLLHGFSSADAFYAETESIFGDLGLNTMQGTVLVLSLPRRADCAPTCKTDPASPWTRLSDSLLDTTRFLIEVHQEPARAHDFTPHAFVYLPDDNARLSTYVKALASAALIGTVVELSGDELESENVQHLAARSVAKGQPALNIESPLLEGNTTATAAQLRKGLVNVLRHLKMISGGVGWQGATKRVKVEQLPDGFFGGN